MSTLDLDLRQCEPGADPRMTRAAVFLFMLLLAGCGEEKPTQPVNEMIESPVQNTVISSFDRYPPRPVTEADLVSFTPTGCTGERQALRLLSTEAMTEGEADGPLLTEPE